MLSYLFKKDLLELLEIIIFFTGLFKARYIIKNQLKACKENSIYFSLNNYYVELSCSMLFAASTV